MATRGLGHDWAAVKRLVITHLDELLGECLLLGLGLFTGTRTRASRHTAQHAGCRTQCPNLSDGD